MAASIAKRLDEIEKIFKAKGTWIRNDEAKNEEGVVVEPTSPEAAQFCLLGAAKHVGDGTKLLIALATAINPRFNLHAWHAEYHGYEPAEFRPKRDCDEGEQCVYTRDKNEMVEEVITEYNDSAARGPADIRRKIQKAKKLVAKAV